MPALMHSVPAKPRYRALRWSRITMDATPLPLGIVKSREGSGCQACGQVDFAAHLFEAVVAVSGKDDPLIAVDGPEAGSVFDQGKIEALPLGEQDVTEVAAVLQCGPDLRHRSPP